MKRIKLTWEEEITLMILDILANPCLECGERGEKSYMLDPLIRRIRKEKRKSFKEGQQSKWMYGDMEKV